MKLSCPACGWSAEIPDERLPPAGAQARCKSCERAFTFDGFGLRDEDATPVNPIDAVTPPPAPKAAAAGPAAALAGAGWWVRTPAGERGPIDLAEIKSLIRSGRLGELDEILTPGQKTWTRAADSPGLHRFFAIKARAERARQGPDAEEDTTAACARHPSMVAEWTCGSCGALLCDACVITKDIGTVRDVRTCPACEGACRRVERAKKIVPFYRDLHDVFAFPVRGMAWITLVICAGAWWATDIALYIPSLLMTICAWILRGAIFAYLLMILREASTGSRKLPNAGIIEDFYRQMVFPGFRGIAVTLIVFIPMFAYSCFIVPQVGLLRATGDEATFMGGQVDLDDPDLKLTEEEKRAFLEFQAQVEQMAEQAGVDLSAPPEEDEEEDDAGGWDEAAYDAAAAERARDEMPQGGWALPFWLSRVKLIHVLAYALLLLWALTLLPLLLIIVALFNTIMPAFNPALVLRIAGEVRKDYTILVGFTVVVLIVKELLSGPFLFIPIIGGLFSALVAFYFNFVLFHAMGRVAEQLEAKVDW